MDGNNPQDALQVLGFVRLGGILPAIVIIAGTWIAVRTVSGFMGRLGARFTEKRLLIQQAATILQLGLYVSGIVIAALFAFRFSQEMMIAVGGTVAVAVGIAFKDLAASVISGILILVDRPFQVGDRVTFAGKYGEISRIGLRSVRMVTLDDSVVTIPNNKFLTDVVTSGNAGCLDMQVVMDFHIGVDQDIGAAKEVVRDAVTSSRYTYLAKPWGVLVNSVITDNYVAVRIRGKAYVLDVKYEKAFETDVTERVLAAFRRQGIEPPAILHKNVGGGASANDLSRAA